MTLHREKLDARNGISETRVRRESEVVRRKKRAERNKESKEKLKFS